MEFRYSNSIVEIILSHCTDPSLQSLFITLMKSLVELPCEGSYAHDIWMSLVEFAENLVNVSNQRNARANLGINVGIDN